MLEELPMLQKAEAIALGLAAYQEFHAEIVALDLEPKPSMTFKGIPIVFDDELKPNEAKVIIDADGWCELQELKREQSNEGADKELKE
jgi:hypothetical protein